MTAEEIRAKVNTVVANDASSSDSDDMALILLSELVIAQQSIAEDTKHIRESLDVVCENTALAQV
jgi:hypothetical protein